jgi:trigger factor
VIDFEGFVDGVAFDGGKAEGHDLELGSGQFIPGFEDQIVGHNIGEEFDVVVTFPEEYGAKELAGKEAVFKIKLHEIKVKELPEIDDEFAKDVSEFDTLAELKADIKAKALERKQKANDEEVENALVQQIVDSIKGEIPEAMFENRLNQSVEEFAYRLQSQGLNLETYLKYTNSSIEDFKNSFRPQAESQVKFRLALEKIVELEKIEATEEDINEQFEKMAKDYGMEVAQIKAAVPAEEIAKDLAVGKAIDFIKDNAVITEKKAAAKKTTAKKTTAKKAEEETKDAE